MDSLGHPPPSEDEKVAVSNTRFLLASLPAPAPVSVSVSVSKEEAKEEALLPLLPPSVSLLGEGEVQTFEQAREVFLRCTARLEEAKKTFPMDGKRREEMREGEGKEATRTVSRTHTLRERERHTERERENV